MQTDIKITIIVTVYNKENTIRKCITSLLKQDCNQFEVIIIDDGSLDNSLSICKEMLANKQNYNIVEQQHCGVSYTRNKGLSLAKSDYVMFVDGDDWLEENTVSTMVDIINSQKVQMIVYGFFRELEHGKPYPINYSLSKLFNRQDILNRFTELWNTGLFYSVCNKIFYLPLLKLHNIQFQNLDFGEDFQFIRQVMEKCDSVFIEKQCFYHYTTNIKGSLSTIYREDLFDLRLTEHCKMIKYFKSLGCFDKQAQEFLARRHIERIVGCIENICSPENHSTVKSKINQIKKIVDDKNTYDCAVKANISSKKMKMLIKPIKEKKYIVCLLLGYIMSFCRNYIPNLFINLKMHR